MDIIARLNELISSLLTAYSLAVVCEGHLESQESLDEVNDFAEYCNGSSRMLMNLVVRLGGSLRYITNQLSIDEHNTDYEKIKYFRSLTDKFIETFNEFIESIRLNTSLNNDLNEVIDTLNLLEAQARDVRFNFDEYIDRYKDDIGEDTMNSTRQLFADKGKEAKRLLAKGLINNPNSYLKSLLVSNKIIDFAQREEYSMIFSMNFADDWSGQIESGWAPPEGLFTKSAEEIVKVLTEQSKDKKQAMSRLVFYINRAGSNLSAERKAELERAKLMLHEEGTR